MNLPTSGFMETTTVKLTVCCALFLRFWPSQYKISTFSVEHTLSRIHGTEASTLSICLLIMIRTAFVNFPLQTKSLYLALYLTDSFLGRTISETDYRTLCFVSLI